MSLLTYLSQWGWLSLLALGCVLFTWVAVAKRNKKLEYIFKPATMVVLLLVAWLMANGQHSSYVRSWFLPALFFSLCGDIFLMFQGNRFFIMGLISFLLAHLCYTAGLNPSIPPSGAWVILVGVIILYFIVYPNIDRGLRQKEEHQLRIPAALYAVILSLMLGSTWVVLLRPDWSSLSKIVVIFGGCLFYISDLLLAWNRFVKHTPQRDIAVMITYQLAQILLTATIVFGP